MDPMLAFPRKFYRIDELTRTARFCRNSLKREAEVMERHEATSQNPSEHLESLRLSCLSVKMEVAAHVDLFLCWLWGTYSCVPQSYGLTN